MSFLSKIAPFPLGLSLVCAGCLAAPANDGEAARTGMAAQADAYDGPALPCGPGGFPGGAPGGFTGGGPSGLGLAPPPPYGGGYGYGGYGDGSPYGFPPDGNGGYWHHHPFFPPPWGYGSDPGLGYQGAGNDFPSYGSSPYYGAGGPGARPPGYPPPGYPPLLPPPPPPPPPPGPYGDHGRDYH
jgi:hypothetical protein